MTDGTSQGLFIVVAIVIFGIFVVMAYILFEDTLSPAMASMFTEATEQASERMVNKPNLIKLNYLKAFGIYHSGLDIVGNTAHLTMNDNKPVMAFSVEESDFEINLGSTYTVSGYLYMDGVPVKESQWTNRRATSWQTGEYFYVDDTTGYFESTQTWSTPSYKQYILHTEIKGSNISGRVLTLKNLKVVEDK